MKRKPVILLLAIATVISLVGVCAGIWSLKLFSAAYCNTMQSSYEINIPEVWEPFFLCLSAVCLIAFAVCVALLVLRVKQKEKAGRASAVFGAFVCVVSILCLALCCPKALWLNAELEKAAAALPSDYIASEWFQEMTLDDLKNEFSGVDDDTENYPIYFGRANCAACESFENKLESILSDENIATVMPAYYTSEDRDGERSSEMYELLDDIGVESVPSVLVVENGHVLYNWSDPASSLDQIRAYLEKGELPASD